MSQVVPVPMAITADAIKESIVNCALSQMDRMGRRVPIDFAELPSRTDLKQVVKDGVPFFHIELPDGQRLFHKIKGYFPLQFGRFVVMFWCVFKCESFSLLAVVRVKTLV